MRTLRVSWILSAMAVFGLSGGPKLMAGPEAPVKGASISGTVKVKGDVKKRKKIKMDADPKCAAMHAEPPLMEDIVVDGSGNVQWAFVYVKKGAEGKKPSEAQPPAVINQTGCHYEPHVLGIVVGADLTVRNSDDLLHNIHALPFSNKEFNFGQPSKGLEEKKQFSTQEIMVKVKCDVHPWMSAWIGVVDHGFFAVTGPDGKYAIPAGLPDGKYTVEVWHEGYKSVSADVDVKGGAAVADFELTDKRE
ncbi:MAG TPA: carboxypeptidase regulatory-like domain-containing protein [Planctomycetota bacterium]|nr:carboxypeptidase regulatory-like domain-containing protein [Planctomycetota bacterium]